MAAGILAGIYRWRVAGLHTRNTQLAATVEERTLDLRQHVAELEDSMLHIKRREGLLPICASCRKIRSDASFSHGICPECVERLYPGL